MEIKRGLTSSHGFVRRPITLRCTAVILVGLRMLGSWSVFLTKPLKPGCPCITSVLLFGMVTILGPLLEILSKLVMLGILIPYRPTPTRRFSGLQIVNSLRFAGLRSKTMPW